MFGAPKVDYHYLPDVVKIKEPIIPQQKETEERVNRLRNRSLDVVIKGDELATQVVVVAGKYKLEMVEIPKGQFVMGSNAHEDEKPRHMVKIEKPFWMGQYEITNELYALFDSTHDSRHEHRHGYQFGRIGYPLNNPNQPVVRVSWQEAMSFCDWLSTKTGKKFSLPTESQWEWACRAGTDTPYYFGEIGRAHV